MSYSSLDQAAREVLRRYPSLLHARSLTPLGNRGGFSGACLWRLECDLGSLCLRAWPDGIVAESLILPHDLMMRARRANLDFVPMLHTASTGRTCVEIAGRLWEVASWQPGRADFHAHPSTSRLRAACAALARLHLAWSGPANSAGRCPAAQRRLARAHEWLDLVASGWRAPMLGNANDPLQSVAVRAWELLSPAVFRVPQRLAAWVARSVPLQPCLCDVWHDHLLFEGETLTGLIDYGGVKIDHVAVDLARLLGSLIGDDRELHAAGIAAYRREGLLSVEEEALVKVLDETGTILGAANWLRWLYVENRQYVDREAVARRLAALVQRMESW